MIPQRENCFSPAFDNKTVTEGCAQLVRIVDPSTAISELPVPSTEGQNLSALFQKSSFERHFRPESTILLHGAKAEAVYRVVSGTIRCCTIDPDGGRQIFSFAKKGDYIGFSDIDTWHFTAEAVDHVILKSVSRSLLEQAMAVNVSMRTEIWALMRGHLVRRERQLLSLITQKAPERLLGFLQDFSATRPSTSFVALPMCRRDIADHLGMTTETTSRAFSLLKKRGAIEMATAEKYRLLR